MQFFIPATNSIHERDEVYQAIKQHVGQGESERFSEKRIRFLKWAHDGKHYEAEVGTTTSFNGETVCAILHEPKRSLYHVCTPNRGVLRALPILASAPFVDTVIEFTAN